MARSNQQNEKMREERKKQIQTEALRQFANKGLSATKIKDIADAVGMAQGLIYHYYKSKEDIYVELIKDSLDKMNQAAIALRGMSEPPHIKIKTAIEEMLKVIENSEDFVQTCRLIAQATNSTAIPENEQKPVDKMRDIPYQAIAKIMEEGQKEGTIIEADPHELALIFWATINGLAIYQASRPYNVKMPDARLLTKIFLKKE